MFEAFLNKLKESLEGITAIFGGFSTVFASFIQLAAANAAKDDEDVEA